jgi:hypothetical protein
MIACLVHCYKGLRHVSQNENGMSKHNSPWATSSHGSREVREAECNVFLALKFAFAFICTRVA